MHGMCVLCNIYVCHLWSTLSIWINGKWNARQTIYIYQVCAPFHDSFQPKLMYHAAIPVVWSFHQPHKATICSIINNQEQWQQQQLRLFMNCIYYWFLFVWMQIKICQMHWIIFKIEFRLTCFESSTRYCSVQWYEGHCCRWARDAPI